MTPFSSYLETPEQCNYLPDRVRRLEYGLVPTLTKQEYLALINQGWRRSGVVAFRPQCGSCTACQPIRILASAFEPDRSQRRVSKANTDTVLVISEPTLDDDRLRLYYDHHAHHARTKGWPRPKSDGGFEHITSIIEGAIPVEEWAYYIDGQLVAVSYIDHLEDGLSGIYFYHDPNSRRLSLGTWMCLSMIQEAAKNSLPYVYLGYYIKGCRSMEYKGRFNPHEILNGEGKWVPHTVDA